MILSKVFCAIWDDYAYDASLPLCVHVYFYFRVLFFQIITLELDFPVTLFWTRWGEFRLWFGVTGMYILSGASSIQFSVNLMVCPIYCISCDWSVFFLGKIVEVHTNFLSLM